MLLCLRAKTLPLAVRALKESSSLCRRYSVFPAAVRLYQRPLTSRPSAAFYPSAFHGLGLHTSSQRHKKREEPPESVLVTTTRRHWQEIKTTPKPALFLGVAGLVPFVAAPLAMCLTHFYLPALATMQVMYGACILSFLGGVRWGYTLPGNSPAKLSWCNLVTGAFFPYFAFMSLLTIGDVGAATLGLILGFGVCLACDVLGMRDIELAAVGPLWYRWLRVTLTVIVVLSLVATLRCSRRYPELEMDYLKELQKQKMVP